MDYSILRTKGMFAVDCEIHGNCLTIGALVLREPKGVISVSPLIGENILIDLTGLATGTHYKVILPNGVVNV